MRTYPRFYEGFSDDDGDYKIIGSKGQELSDYGLKRPQFYKLKGYNFA